MEIQGLSLLNEEKANRAIYGTVGGQGQMIGGVGEDASDSAKIAAYDKLGGLIKKGKYSIKTGCFFDFKKNKAIEKPEIIFVMRDLNGHEVEVPEGEQIPLEVKAVEIQQEKKAKKGAEKKAKKDIEDEE